MNRLDCFFIHACMTPDLDVGLRYKNEVVNFIIKGPP